MITKQDTGAASGVAAGANVGQKTRSYAIAYTISEALSVNVGTEKIDPPAGQDAELPNHWCKLYYGWNDIIS